MELNADYSDVHDDFFEHLTQAAWQLKTEHGPLSLFAIFEREEVPGLWDLVASASWLGVNRHGISQIADAVNAHLKAQEREKIARIVPIPQGSQFIRFVQSAYAVQVGNKLLLNPTVLGGVQIRGGCVIMSDQSAAIKPSDSTMDISRTGKAVAA